MRMAGRVFAINYFMNEETLQVRIKFVLPRLLTA